MAFTGLSDAFGIMYLVLMIACIAILMGVMVMVLIDKISIMLKAIGQARLVASMTNSLMVKDAYDQLYMHYHGNNVKDEPLFIYTTQQLLTSLFNIGGITLMVLAAQIAIYACLLLYAKARGEDFDEKIVVPFKYIMVIFLIEMNGYITAAMYKNNFQKKIQPTIQKHLKGVRSMNAYIYSWLPTDEAFYQKLPVPADVFAHAIDLAAQNNVSCLTKVVFAYSLYEYMQRLMPPGNTDHTLQNLFSFDNIRDHTIDWHNYLKYDDVNIVRNSVNKFGLPALSDDLTFKRNLAQALQHMNMQFAVLRHSTDIKAGVDGYLSNILLVCTIFLIAVIICFADRIAGIVVLVVAWVKQVTAKKTVAAVPGAPDATAATAATAASPPTSSPPPNASSPSASMPADAIAKGLSIAQSLAPSLTKNLAGLTKSASMPAAFANGLSIANSLAPGLARSLTGLAKTPGLAGLAKGLAPGLAAAKGFSGRR